MNWKKKQKKVRMMDRGNKRMRKMREKMRHRDSVTRSNMGLTVNARERGKGIEVLRRDH